MPLAAALPSRVLHFLTVSLACLTFPELWYRNTIVKHLVTLLLLHVVWALNWVYNLFSKPQPFLAQTHNPRCLVLSRLGGTQHSKLPPLDEIPLKIPSKLEEGLLLCFILGPLLPLHRGLYHLTAI